MLFAVGFFLSHFILFSNSFPRAELYWLWTPTETHKSYRSRGTVIMFNIILKMKTKKNSNGTLITVDWYFYRVFISGKTVYRPSAVCYHFRIRCNYLDVLFFSVVFCRTFIYSWRNVYQILSILTTFLCVFFCIDTHN